MSNMRVYLVSGLMILLALALYPMFVGGSSNVPDQMLQLMVYVDEKTDEAFAVRARSSREPNPETGERTLIPGLYCEKCQKWKPVGPIEALQNGRSIRKCPIHKTILTKDGPLPETKEKSK